MVFVMTEPLENEESGQAKAPTKPTIDTCPITNKLAQEQCASFALVTLTEPAPDSCIDSQPECVMPADNAVFTASDSSEKNSVHFQAAPAYCHVTETFLGTGMLSKYFWLHTFNFVYWGIAVGALYIILPSAQIPYFGTEVLLAMLVGLAILWALNLLQFQKVYRQKYLCTTVELPTAVQKGLRAAALLLPLVPIVMATADFYALKTTEHPTNGEMFTPGIKTVIPEAESYARKLDTAASLTFYNAGTLNILADRARQAGLHQESLIYADQALALFPQNESSKIEKGLTLISKQELASQARPWLDEQLRWSPRDGNLWGLKTRLELQTGNYQDALEAANVHLQFHSQEPAAYRLRATVNECLNRSEDAGVDLAKASQLENGFVTQ